MQCPGVKLAVITVERNMINYSVHLRGFGHKYVLVMHSFSFEMQSDLVVSTSDSKFF